VAVGGWSGSTDTHSSPVLLCVVLYVTTATGATLLACASMCRLLGERVRKAPRKTPLHAEPTLTTNKNKARQGPLTSLKSYLT